MERLTQHCVTFATNRNLDGNSLTMFEVCQSDMESFASVELTVPAFKLTACTNSGATLGDVNGTPVCIVKDCSSLSTTAAVASAGTSTTAPTETPASTTPSPGTDASVLNNGTSNSSSSVFSSKAIVVIGGISFFIGILVSVFGFVLYRKRKAEDDDAKGKSPNNYLSFVLEQRTNTDRDLEDESDDSWVFGDPNIFPNAVALLEEDDDKRKKPGQLDDLLVYEIPPEEIRMKGALPGSSDISSAHQSPSVMFLADYQGYQVVLHALLRQKKNKKREERRFIEQIRLASTVEHPSIVQFIGLTFGTTNQQQHAMSPRWKFAVVFEYMHKGSLASMFQGERSRREGKLYYQDGMASHAGISGNLFHWFPSSVSQNTSPNPDSDWRCKLSIALDIAMGLVYLHSCHMVHGSLKSSNVLVNDHGEAKLSALDMKQPSDSEPMPREDSIRQSARVKMKKMIGFKQSSFTQSQLGSSLLHGGASDMPPTPAPALDVGSPKYKETKDDIYAFGVFLWELDTMLSIDMMKNFSTNSAAGDEHNALKFTDDCPSEIKYLARRCWNPDIRQRPDALDLQEELVQLLEGRITTSSQAVSSWLRTTNLSFASSFSSSKMSSSSVYALSESEADV